ncbi:protein rae1 [Quercus suber]|uniref:Protein rae1 n=1 Tax=Quercus suber TaxID=58331 RepID=A0AAW0LAJ9_QUESU
MIFKSSPSFHIDRSKLLAALKFIGFTVRKRPVRLRENSSNMLSLYTDQIAIASSSSVVSFICCIRSRTSDSMVPKANYLVATSWDNQMLGDNADHGAGLGSTPKASMYHDQLVLCSTWKHDGMTEFSRGCDKQVKMWPLSGNQPVTVAMHDGAVKDIAWIPEMNLLVTGSWDKTLRYWDTRQSNLMHTQQLSDRCYAFPMQHPLMVVGTTDRNLITEFKRITSPLKYQTRCVVAFPDQQRFLVGSIEVRVGVHHLYDSQPSQTFIFKCHRDGKDIYSVNSLNFHPVHHSFTTAGSDGGLNFWDKDSVF